MFSRSGWAGVLLPSVDRVGRYFPLTLAAALAVEGLDARRTLLNAMPWLEALEGAGLEALSPELDLEAFDRRLAGLAPPADVAAALPVNDDTVPLGGRDFEVWPLTADGLSSVPALGRSASSAMWMTAGGDSVAAALAACAGAIPGERFCALLDGRWKDHGWTVLEPKLYCDPKNPGVDLFNGQGMPGGVVPPLTASPESHNGAQGGARVGEESSS
jgi:type VI secretion system protein ImpM